MKKMIAVAAVALVGTWIVSGVFGDRDDDRDDKSDEQSAASETTWNNQVWIDKIPVRETDKINIFAALDDPQFGVYQSTSQWEGEYTVFSWRARGDSGADIEMMQTGKKHKLKFSLSTNNCGRFDVCMTVKGAPSRTEEVLQHARLGHRGRQRPNPQCPGVASAGDDRRRAGC